MSERSDAMPEPGPKKYGDCSITLCTSALIGNRVLAALSDKVKVACIFDCDDLTLLINALSAYQVEGWKHKAMQHDLRQLRCAAFAVPIAENVPTQEYNPGVTP